MATIRIIPSTSPSFCTRFTERVYIAASGCERDGCGIKQLRAGKCAVGVIEASHNQHRAIIKQCRRVRATARVHAACRKNRCRLGLDSIRAKEKKPQEHDGELAFELWHEGTSKSRVFLLEGTTEVTIYSKSSSNFNNNWNKDGARFARGGG